MENEDQPSTAMDDEQFEPLCNDVPQKFYCRVDIIH